MDATLQRRAEELARDMAGDIGTIEDLNKLLAVMLKSGLERMLNTEMDVHLGRRGGKASDACSATPPETDEDSASKRSSNRRNGRSRKTVRSSLGEIELSTPRDRNGTFEPQIIGKYQRRVPGFDEKILALYAKGMTARDIQELVRELYGVEVSATLISEITADLDAEVTAWRSRPLEEVWPIVFFDGITVHVRGANGRVSQHTIYVALGINLQGRKELLGLWINQSEGAKFWLSCLTDLKNRGLRDIFVVCIDGLSGFSEAVHTAYPEAKVQLCVVHLVRAALRYVSTEDAKEVARDLKAIYQAPTVLEAERLLEEFDQTWGTKYPTIVNTWRSRWADIITLFDFPYDIRRVIYTTNAIESVNSVIRKFTRNRKIYPNEESALKLVYMAITEASKKWTRPIRHWKKALNHFAIMFEDRMPEHLSK